ncbi:MAG: pseudouridine synthase [Flavobacterium sp.]
MSILNANSDHFHPFSSDVSTLENPDLFTFPFYYEPHPLAIQAAKELQNYLENQKDFEHNFGLDQHQNGLVIGKMFGVLVVKNNNNERGFLAAFSGKLAESNHHWYFVPPVFDLLENDGFFKNEEDLLNQINRKIEALIQSKNYLEAQQALHDVRDSAKTDLERQKEIIRLKKIERDAIRKENATDESLEISLKEESKKENILLKKMTQYWQHLQKEAQNRLDVFEKELQFLKEHRKQKSSELQQIIFDHYSFLNAHRQTKSLGLIFENNPPAGAGECAAPKLLQYAYLHHYEPIAMAEFWWGQGPKSEIRKHKLFYPACRSKCEPILNHMLEGLNVELNPMLDEPHFEKKISVIYEDDVLAVVVKPTEFLSVPGKNVQTSVFTEVQKMFPNATGPLIVHRLDMSTSGLLLIAKTEDSYQNLQSQFIKRTIEKRYVALLDGIVKIPNGEINLPLRVDLDHRPHQLVCYEHGKNAVTKFEVVEIKNKQTRIYFYPITGRTHQLRVHAAHPLGLNTPIVGDDLYGQKKDRLCLHAELISFSHPQNGEHLTFSEPADF